MIINPFTGELVDNGFLAQRFADMGIRGGKKVAHDGPSFLDDILTAFGSKRPLKKAMERMRREADLEEKLYLEELRKIGKKS
jgi:hypothetical protein